MKCKKCDGDMAPGIAIENITVGYPDFIGDKVSSRVGCFTMSKTGPPVIIDVLKCKDCGHSIKN